MRLLRCVILFKRKGWTKTKLNSDNERLRGSDCKIFSFVRLVQLFQLSEGVVSSVLLRIGRAWVETKGLCEGIQDLWSPCRMDMCRRQGVGTGC